MSDHADLTKTREALRAYDDHQSTGCPDSQLEAWDAKSDQLDKAVAEAFAADTADRNDRDTILSCIHPGPAIPPSGSELSFVRLCVRWWETHRIPVSIARVMPPLDVFFRKACDYGAVWQTGTIVRVEPIVDWKVWLKDSPKALDFNSYEWEQAEG